MRKMLVPILSAFLAGCAIGNKIDYHEGRMDLSEKFNSDSKLFVLVRDIRPYVLSGDKTSSFVGLSRSLYGIPYPVHTQSGKPLADDLSGVIARSIEESISDVKHTLLAKGDVADVVIKSNTQTGWKTLLFTLREWKTDISGLGTGAFHYDVTLAVLDSNANQLGTKSALGKGLVNDGRPLSVNIAEVMEGLLNAPNIVLAVNSDNAPNSQADVASKPSVVPPSPEPKPDCTVEQIFGMKNMGMTETQIRAACK